MKVIFGKLQFEDGDLPLDFAKEELETEKSESSGPVTDLSTFNIEFAEGE